MYNAQTTKKRITAMCKNQSMEQMLRDCALGVNAIRQMTDKNGIASFSLARIADYLDCSVDYLLGRTDNPDAHRAQSSFAISNRDTVINGTQANVINNEVVDSEVMELAQLIKSLPLVKRAEAILVVEEIKNRD